ncbi:MAG: hypothetical protein PHN31_01140 [Candidatus Gracilibacteria bacterium]|nr:hypothetical protein [Candidatus Gracilibacteria bacterium]
MSINSGILKEESDKNNEKLKKKEAEINKENLEKSKKQKEKIEVQEQAENNLYELKNMLDKGVLDDRTEDLVEDIVEFDVISQKEIEEIFDEIEEIENTKDIDKVIPKTFRITKDDYKKSLTDEVTRKHTIKKINSALSIIVTKINPKSSVGMNIIGGFLYVIDKKLVKIQENHIDIKNSLNKVEEKSSGKKYVKKSLGQKIIDFFREVINS